VRVESQRQQNPELQGRELLEAGSRQIFEESLLARQPPV